MKWNAISDGLPPMGVPLIVTVKDNMEHGQNKILCPAYYERRRENNGYHFNWRYGDMIYDLLPDVSEVIAWAEFPTPFEEGNEKEIQAYRAIGTVEECRDAVERMKPKKPTYEGDGYAPDGTFVWDEWLCPNCGNRYEVDYDNYVHCPNCGQAIDWREERENEHDGK